MVTLRVKVKPNSKLDKLEIEDNDRLLVSVNATPKDGEANRYLIKYLAKIFNVAKSCVEIDSKSLKSRYKKVLIYGDESEINEILKELKESESLF